ncbi:hypothetical protein DKX38_010766 [Salix brachista]|uniref:Uncharacterized protein n=1 Tax=Salix brachista TaxID=2182728 RepID=A0A5N5ME68_9ROSI|nr:hypothetical protein DKX38_010766 [Salix brachista]
MALLGNFNTTVLFAICNPDDNNFFDYGIHILKCMAAESASLLSFLKNTYIRFESTPDIEAHHFVSSFLWPVFVYKHCYGGNCICHLGSGFIYPVDREYAGLRSGGSSDETPKSGWDVVFNASGFQLEEGLMKNRSCVHYLRISVETSSVTDAWTLLDELFFLAEGNIDYLMPFAGD